MSTSLRPLRAVWIAPLFLLLTALSAFPGTLRAQLVVDRLEIFLSGVDGGASGSFIVTNATEAPLTAELLLQDWHRAEDGTNLFVDAGTVEGSCHPNVRIFPSILLLGPREAQPVQVLYEGSALTTSCWTSVRVRAVAAPSVARDQGVQVSIELHQFVKVYVEPPSGWGDVELLDADVVPMERGPHRAVTLTSEHDIVAVATNPGTVQVWVSGLVEFRSLDNAVVNRSPFADVPILPGAVRRMRVPVPDFPPGRYVALILLDAGGPERAAAQIELEIAP